MSKVSVDAGAYRMVLNIMERTADRIGYPAMREAADELRKTAEVIDARQSAGQERGEAVALEFGDLLYKAGEIVRGKFVWKKFISGTPLDNDVPVWMAEFALSHAHPPADAQRVAELEAQCSHLASALAERTEQLAESREREGRMREALEDLLHLTESERPDWSHPEQHAARAALAAEKWEK